MSNTNQSLLSICIPNYNYAKYIDITFDSLNKQSNKNFSINVVDNASTDDSLGVIKKWSEKFTDFEFKVNSCNVGFAGNLDKVASMSSAPYKIMISSDDVVLPEMTEVYDTFIKNRISNDSNEDFMFGSVPLMIDGDGGFVREMKADSKLWYSTDLDNDISEQMGFNVYKVSSSDMLKRCLKNFRTPMHFITTCYSEKTYNSVGGYGGGRLYNPDKWFSWKALSGTDFIYFLEKPLFEYRWHNSNQQALEKEAGVLKYWYDEYRNSFEVDASILDKAGMTKKEVTDSYNQSIMKGIFRALKNSEKFTAVRLMNWGSACYPNQFKKMKYYRIFKLLIALMPVSSLLLKLVNPKSK